MVTVTLNFFLPLKADRDLFNLKKKKHQKRDLREPASPEDNYGTGSAAPVYGITTSKSEVDKIQKDPLNTLYTCNHYFTLGK